MLGVGCWSFLGGSLNGWPLSKSEAIHLLKVVGLSEKSGSLQEIKKIFFLFLIIKRVVEALTKKKTKKN